MRANHRTENKSKRMALIAKFIVLIGLVAILTPYVLRYLYYQSSVVLALEMEDRMGGLSQTYEAGQSDLRQSR